MKREKSLKCVWLANAEKHLRWYCNWAVSRRLSLIDAPRDLPRTRASRLIRRSALHKHIFLGNRFVCLRFCFADFTKHSAPWCSCLGCGLRLGNFRHKNKPRSVFLPWRQERTFTFFLVRNGSCLRFTLPFFFLFGRRLWQTFNQKTTSWSQTRFVLINRSKKTPAVNNMKSESETISWKVLHYQRWRTILRSHRRQKVVCYSPSFLTF